MTAGIISVIGLAVCWTVFSKDETGSELGVGTVGGVLDVPPPEGDVPEAEPPPRPPIGKLGELVFVGRTWLVVVLTTTEVDWSLEPLATVLSGALDGDVRGG
jgi:hypothetical protein